MDKVYLITAIGTPLDEQEHLHHEGLEAHIDDQWRNGIDGILVAGTMGMFQLLLDDTYQQLVRSSTELGAGRGEVMVGVGDTSLSRSLARVDYVNRFKVDAVVVLTPFFLPFDSEELADYYCELADRAKAPLYLYDLPQVIGRSVPIETVIKVARHPNIHGAKCSGPSEYAQQITDQVDSSFRVIHSKPMEIDTFARAGLTQHLDGIFGLVPHWTVGIGRALDAGDFDLARQRQKRLAELLGLLRNNRVLPAYSALLNERGIPGNYAPRPMRPLNDAEREYLMSQQIVKDALAPVAVTC